MARVPTDEDLGLPNPMDSSDPVLQAQLNALRRREILGQGPQKRKRKEGGNKKYPAETKWKVAADAVLFDSVKQASKVWEHRVGHLIAESTIRGWVKIYKRQIEEGDTVEFIREAKLGRPLLVPADAEKIVIREIKARSAVGEHISNKTAIAIATVTMERKYPSQLKTLKLKKSWSQSLYRRMKFVRRRVTRAARNQDADPEVTAREFYRKIRRAVRNHDIPAPLIMNTDQSGCRLVPSTAYTLAEQGSRQVTINGKDDKRGITALLTSTIEGQLLPPQLVYEGTTKRCHPPNSAIFPPEWDLTQTSNHWSTIESMVRFIKEVVVPYCEEKRMEFDLPDDQKALLILDTYRPHTNSAFGDVCDAANIIRVYVPPGFTSSLQPLDADGGVNQVLKIHLREGYENYYTQCIRENMRGNNSLPANWRMDMRLSTLKPHHAQWFLDAFQAVERREDLIKKGWERTGIKQAIAHLI